MAILTVHFGDEHVGSSLALCPPEVGLDDGGSYKASPLQLWYWECWLRLWAYVAKIKESGVKVLAVCGGDERDGDHHRTVQLWAANEHDQDRAAMQALAVPARIVDAWAFVRGTEAHDGPASAATERYAEAMSRDHCVLRNGNQFSWWCWTGQVEGVKIEVAHAPGTKSWVPHTRAPAASRHAFYTWEEYVEDGIEPPDVVIRHHVHYHAGPGCHEDTCCYIVPGWQAATAYVNNRVMSARRVRRPGALLLYCDKGSYRHEWKLYRPKSGVAWA